MNTHSPSFRLLSLLGIGVATLGLTAGCSNGLQTTAAGDPTAPVLSAAPSTSPTVAPSGAPSTAASSTSPSTSASTSSSTSASPADGTAPTTTSAADAGSARCRLSSLAVSVREADGGAAAGSRYVVLTFRNTGGAPCTLKGYPGVSFVGDGNGTQLGVPAVRKPGATARAVRLSAGSTTTALLQIANAGNYDATACAPTTADGLRVYPPGSTTAAYVEFPAQACQRDPGSSPQLSISPIGTRG